MSNYYASLKNETLLHIVGPDSLTFLQGQTTCDTRKINASQAALGAYCTIKGRVVCDFLLAQITDEHYVLRMRRDILTGSAATLSKYIIFSKAELQTERDDWQVLAFWGPLAKEKLAVHVGDMPDNQYHVVSGDGFVIVQLDTAGCEFECYLNMHSHSKLATELTDNFTEVDDSNWQALQIERGTARLEAATVEAFIPQMLNYDLDGHISFDKGCYTGQEVVARMHYRGTPKRRLYRTVLPPETPARAGDLLYSADNSQSTGTIVNSALTSERLSALVVAQVATADQGFRLGDENGPLLQCDAVHPEVSSNDER